VDDQLVALGRDEHDELEQVGGSVRSDDEPPVGIVTEIVDDERVVDGVDHVGVGDAVSSGRGVDLHTRILYYESLLPATARCVRRVQERYRATCRFGADSGAPSRVLLSDVVRTIRSMGDLFGAATNRLRRRAARRGSPGIVIGVRLIPWYWRWLVDRVVDATDVSVLIDGVELRTFSNRSWKPEFVAMTPGAHVVSVYGSTTDWREARDGKERVVVIGPVVLAEQEFDLGDDEVVSILFRKVAMGEHGRWPQPALKRSNA
jgi:hypothetical protein